MLAIAGGVASAARHLHSQGVMHGDLYGHNILHCEQGNALLGDFGGASLYAPDAAHAPALQRLEVRAFGVLLEELLSRCDAPPAFQPRREHLARLATSCLDVDPAARPLFAEITATLARDHMASAS
jgi:hypothetical protein